MRYYGFIIGIVADCVTSAVGQTVTVAQSGSEAFTTVQAAVASFAGDSDIAPNVITIMDSAVYNEVITLDVPVTLQGTPGMRPVLATQANAAGRGGSSGLVVNLPAPITSGTVVLRNLTVIPSQLAIPQSAAISVVNNNVYLLMEDVLVSGNNGSDGPISSDGLTVVAQPTGVTFRHFRDDGLVFGDSDGSQFEGDGVEVVLRDTLITNLRGTGGTENTCTGIIMNNNTTTDTAIAKFRSLRIEDGCVLSGMNGRGLWQAAIGDFEIDAPNRKALFIRNSQMGILLSASSPNVRAIRGGIFAYNSYQGVYENSNFGPRCTIENSIMTRNNFMNIRVSNAATGPMLIKNSTVAFDPITVAYQSILLDVGTDITFQDCILAGDGQSNTTYNRITNSSGTITLDHTAIVIAGPAAYRVPTFTRLDYVTGSPVRFGDPVFKDTTNPGSPDFFAVTAPAYATAGTGGAPLSGGGAYIADSPVTEFTSTIAKSGSADFMTIQSAIDSAFALHPSDPGVHYTFQILDSGVYDEVIELKVPATIVGVGSARPTLVVQGNPNGYDNDGAGSLATPHATDWSGNAGLLINLPSPAITTCSMMLKNLVIIPSRTGVPPVAGIVNKANNFWLTLDNILVTSNNGNDQPVTLDGLAPATRTGNEVSFLVSGANLGSITNDRAEGAGVDVTMTNCTFSNIYATLGDTWRAGLYLYRTYYVSNLVSPKPAVRAMAFRSLRIGDGCRFTYNDANGLRCAGNMAIDAPNQRVLFLGNLVHGLWSDMNQGGDNANGVVSAYNVQHGINEGVSSIGDRIRLSNAIVANNGGAGVYCRQGDTAQQDPTRLKNVTIANNLLNGKLIAGIIESSTNLSSVDVDLIDSVVAGTADNSTTDAIKLGAKGTFSILFSALVTDGPFAMATQPIITGTPAPSPLPIIVGAPVSNADPVFINTTDALASNFYAVSNTAYGTANSNAGPLSGGGMYLPGSAVHDWSVY